LAFCMYELIMYNNLLLRYFQVFNEPAPLVGQLLEAVLKEEIEFRGKGNEMGWANVEAGTPSLSFAKQSIL